MSGTLHVEPNPEALATYAADWLLNRALSTTGPVRIALSGGSTPKRLYEKLAEPARCERFPWSRTDLFWGDERFVPPDDAESNYNMVNRALLTRAPIPSARVHRAPTEGDPAAAAARYERDLHANYGQDTLDAARPLFDVVLLGLGDNGHTASLFPDVPELEERVRWVVPVTQGVPQPRLSLTYPAIASSGAVVFLVAGRNKAEMLRRVRAGDRSLPAARVTTQGELLWFVDEAASGRA